LAEKEKLQFRLTNNMKNILTKIRYDLKQKVDLKHRDGERKFFKEKIKNYGVKTPVVRQIARKYFQEIENLEKSKIFDLCEELLKSGYTEEATIAFQWAFQIKDQYQKQDFKLFEEWLKKYVSNWGKCDDFCTHTFGYFIFKFPEFLPKLNLWARLSARQEKSKNRWLKRASAVILIYPIKQDKKFLNKIFEISDILLLDQDDLVQKGYGWLLKEASNIYQKQVFDFVMQNKNTMPRTALRYAIEKMPASFRKKAML